MEAEYAKMPRDLNRNQYLKRINEIIVNVKMQKTEIKGILDEIREIQADTEKVVLGIKKIDTDVEEFIFNEAKKDKVASGLTLPAAIDFVDGTINLKGNVAYKAQLYSSLNNTGLANGSTFASIKSGSGDDQFYVSSYNSALDGGAGSNDTVYLNGAASDWKYANDSALSNYALSGSDVTLKNATTNAQITLKNIEKYAFYDTTSSILHTA
jgi:hypothetical protein